MRAPSPNLFCLPGPVKYQEAAFNPRRLKDEGVRKGALEMKIPRQTLLLWLLLIAALASGCATVSGAANPYPGKSYPPTDPAEVGVYRFWPEEPAEKIGEVEVSGTSDIAWDKFQQELRKKAAEIGGQGVIIMGEKSELASIYETPSTMQRYRFGGTFPQTYYFFQPGQYYPIREVRIVGVVVRFKGKGETQGKPPSKPMKSPPK
jgi:hypothetical protein